MVDSRHLGEMLLKTGDNSVFHRLVTFQRENTNVVIKSLSTPTIMCAWIQVSDC